MVYNSVILFDTGVPVANVIPFPPVISSMYLHFINISELFCASVCEMPATFRIFVYKKGFCNNVTRLQTACPRLIAQKSLHHPFVSGHSVFPVLLSGFSLSFPSA